MQYIAKQRDAIHRHRDATYRHRGALYRRRGAKYRHMGGVQNIATGASGGGATGRAHGSTNWWLQKIAKKGKMMKNDVEV